MTLLLQYSHLQISEQKRDCLQPKNNINIMVEAAWEMKRWIIDSPQKYSTKNNSGQLSYRFKNKQCDI